MSRQFLLGVPREVHLAHLKREREAGGRWTGEAARVCVLLDLDRDRLLDATAYGRMWRWNVASRGPNKGEARDEVGRSAVRRAWSEIVADVLDWVTFYGRSLGSPLVARVPDDWWEHARFDRADLGRENDRQTTGERPHDDRENAESDAYGGTNDRQTTGERPRDDRHTVQISDLQISGGGDPARAHEADGGSERRAEPPAETEAPPLSPRPHGSFYEAAAVTEYAAAAGCWPQHAHAAAIARRFADPEPDVLTAWAEHVTTWAVTPRWNVHNVPTLLQSFDEQLARRDAHRDRGADARRRGGAPQPDGTAGHGRGTPDSLVGSLERTLALVRGGAVAAG